MRYKYDLTSIIIIVCTLTVLAVGGLALSNLSSFMGSELQTVANDMDINQTYANQSVDFLVNDSASFSDNYIFWFFLATFVGLILTAMYLEFEPAVMIIIFIFGSIAVLGAWLGSEINSEFATDTDLAVTATDMSKTQLLMSNPYFPIFIFIALIIMLVVMYTKKRQGEYQ
jgi:hypothetical protein